VVRAEAPGAGDRRHYRPETDRQSHCFRSRVADQFDAVIHVDEIRAAEPLERTARREEGEVPETYPFAV
jgi:erythromycin esterase-like protein